jgi:glycosyltransferase involved in cell wall biosynthesis
MPETAEGLTTVPIQPAASSNRPGRICCYARVRDTAFFESHEFYRTDIAILRELGYEVAVTNSVAALLKERCDFFFGWWFGYGIFPAVYGWLRRKPVLVSGVLHTQDCGGLEAWPPLKRWTMKLTMRLANCSIVCSPGEFERLEGFAPRHCEIVPLSIDMSTYQWPEHARDLQREPRVMMVTQLNRENVERKMVIPAIRAFAAFSAVHPEFRLTICGAIGDGIDTVREAVADAGIESRVDILGRVTIEKKLDLLGRAFAYLQPTRCEGFGLALGEALACGTPVVTSPERCVVGTYGEAVRYGSSETDLARRLMELASDASRYRTLQQRGFDHVQQYSYVHRRERFRRILDGLRR